MTKNSFFECSLLLSIPTALAIEAEICCLDAPTAHLDKNALILLNKSSLV
jgi:energy-coupling factor transporter ATP-binding protein EcfA2